METIYTQACDYMKNGVDEIRIYKDFEDELEISIDEGSGNAKIVLTQEHAKELAYAILDNLDINVERKIPFEQYLTQFRNNEIAFNFKTKSGWEDFLNFLEYNSSITWACGEDLTNPVCIAYWDVYGEDTYLVCYNNDYICYDGIGVNHVPIVVFEDVR